MQQEFLPLQIQRRLRETIRKKSAQICVKTIYGFLLCSLLLKEPKAIPTTEFGEVLRRLNEATGASA